ncbi:MAG TPA: iron-sulfur cluster assembly scaffold protein [Terriglobales bacterium]|jgi:nitrogen fixation NifU-like protein|nr:iron-sulfur cluster assembly scaffold protein [Terriglobales bacterium]
MYSSQVLDHFEHPRNVGELERADAAAEVENPACGDVMRLSLKLRDGRIAEARYRTQGCVTAIACGSRLTELLLGRTLDQARALRRQELVGALGGLSPETTHASHLAMDALAAVLTQLQAPRPASR